MFSYSILHLFGRSVPVVDWYHSHPGFSCWLSGLDVYNQRSTQLLYPVVIIVDHIHTISSSIVQVGSNIPLEMIKEWGDHAFESYNMTFIQSEIDKTVLEAMTVAITRKQDRTCPRYRDGYYRTGYGHSPPIFKPAVFART